MLFKSTIFVLSVFWVSMGINSIQCDLSNVVFGGENAVDTGTVEVLRKNISDYLVELEQSGSPQMQLMQIHSASKEIVTGTLYTVQALLQTPDGAKNCEITILEKNWIDFCHVRVKCEYGGQYEVTFNPNYVSQDVSHELSLISQYLPTTAQPVTQPTTQAQEISVNPPHPFQFNIEQVAVFELPPLPPKIDVLPPAPEPNYDFPNPSKPELIVLPEGQLPKGDGLERYLTNLFHDFITKYERLYIIDSNEKMYRYGVFKENFHTMLEHSRTDRLACEYSVTEFADLTTLEFDRNLGWDTSLLNASDIVDDKFRGYGKGRPVIGVELPEHYDQREHNLVTRVKSQGDCGACWAFVTTAVIEGLCAKHIKKLQEFSEQSLIDCDTINYGCKGGAPPNALKHIARRGGLELESRYPYLYKQMECHYDPHNVRVKVSGAIGFKKNDEIDMVKWLFKNGPILVGINADPLKYYKGGVLNPTPALCNPKKINHGVTLIGYGVEKNTSTGERLPYWIVKNQWGTQWGEDGFFRIARGKNACGLALWAYSAKLSNVPNNCWLKHA